MRAAALPPCRIALDRVGGPACSQTGGEHERVVGIEPRGRGDGALNLVQHRSRGETDTTILEAHVILEVGFLGQARDLHTFGVIEDALEELRADLEGTLLPPPGSERTQDVGEPEHGVQVTLKPDRGEGGARQMGAHGAVGPEDEPLLGDGGLGRRQLLRRAEEGPRSFRVEGSPCEVVERRWRLTKDAHAFR